MKHHTLFDGNSNVGIYKSITANLWYSLGVYKSEEKEYDLIIPTKKL